MTSKIAALTLLAIISLAGPLIDAAINGRVNAFDKFEVVEVFLSAAVIYWWYHVDKHQRNYKAGPLMNVGMVGLAIFILPVYFIRSRGWKQGTISSTLAALVLIGTFVLGELGERIGAAIAS